MIWYNKYITHWERVQVMNKGDRIREVLTEEAIEFFDYNVDGLILGKNQPIIIDDTGV